jgi:predicted transcriptional regulator
MTPGTVAHVPNTPGTPRRTIRVPDALWEAAAEKAKTEDTDLSTIIRKALERYVRRRQ